METLAVVINREQAQQISHVEGLDTKASLLLGFVRVLVWLAPGPVLQVFSSTATSSPPAARYGDHSPTGSNGCRVRPGYGGSRDRGPVMGDSDDVPTQPSGSGAPPTYATALVGKATAAAKPGAGQQPEVDGPRGTSALPRTGSRAGMSREEAQRLLQQLLGAGELRRLGVDWELGP